MTAARIAVSADLTIGAVAQLRDRLLAALAERSPVDVDLSQVAEIDGAGVQLLVAARREAEARNTVLRFVAHSAAVLDVLELCGLDLDLTGPRPAAPA